MADPAPPAAAEPRDVVSIVRSPEASRELRLFAARCLLPLERDDTMRALLAVVADPDEEVSAAARQTLVGMPPDELVRFVERAQPTGVELDVLSRHCEDHFVLERVIRHGNVHDETLLRLASTVTGSPQDALIVNQVRLIRKPALIEALLGNPELTADGRRRLNELYEEFFEKELRRKEVDRLRREEEESRARREAEDIEEAAPAEEPEAVAEPSEPVDPAAEAGLAAVYRRIAAMTIKEKVDLAQKGTKEERRILIADVNKLVSLAVLKCESIGLSEIENFCTMRHIHSEVFQEIAATREWIKKPKIQFALVTNPAVPLNVTLPLVKYMGLRDLRNIMRDRNLPEGIRLAARKILFEKRG